MNNIYFLWTRVSRGQKWIKESPKKLHLKMCPNMHAVTEKWITPNFVWFSWRKVEINGLKITRLLSFCLLDIDKCPRMPIMGSGSWLRVLSAWKDHNCFILTSSHMNLKQLMPFNARAWLDGFWTLVALLLSHVVIFNCCTSARLKRTLFCFSLLWNQRKFPPFSLSSSSLKKITVAFIAKKVSISKWNI